MSDRYEVVLLVDASGAVRAFQSVSGEAAKTAQSLNQVGTAGVSGLGKVNQASTQTASNLGRVSSAASTLQRAAAGVAASTLVGFLADAAREAANAQAIQTRLQTSVEATGKSYDDYASSIDNAIQKSQALAFDDEDTAAALATLTQQTGDAGTALGLLATAQDLARGKGIGLADAATIVGKVATGNTAILQRYGIVVDKNASSTEALAAINQKFAGQSQAFADTTQGALDRAQVAWHNFVEEVGGAAGPMQTVIGLLPGLTSGFNLVSGAVGALSGAGGFAGLLAAVNPVTLAIGGAVVAGGLIVKTLADQQQAADGAAKSYADLHTAIQSVGDAQARTTFQSAQLAPPTAQQSTQARSLNATTGLLAQDQPAPANAFTNVPSDQQVKAINDAVNQTIALANARDLSTEAVNRAAAGEAKLSDAVRTNSKSADDAISILTDFNSIMNYDQEGADKLHEQALKLFDGFRAGSVTLDGLRDGMHHFAEDERSMGQAMAGTGAQLATATDQYGALVKILADLKQKSDDANAAIQRLNGASEYAAKYQAGPTAGFELSPEQRATNAAGLEQASSDAIAKANQDKASAVQGAVNLISRAYDDEAQAAKDASQQEIAAINDAYDAQQRQIGRQGNLATNAAQSAGREQVRQAQVASRGQVREAELAQTRQTNAARSAADAQIAAAKDAADAQTQAAKDAADAQVSEAERAGNAQVRAAQQAANEQIRAANAAAHDQVAQAQKAAHEQEAAATRLVATVTASAKAQQDATVKAAQAAHDQAVAQANKTADAEIAAAKRSADQQLLQLQRRTQAQQSAARDQANKAIEQANDQAARAIRGGADPGKVAKDLENATKKAYADQEKAQQNAANRQQRQQDAIQAREQQKVDAANAYKEQATKAADDRLQAIQDQAQQQEQARIAAATKQAADMKKAAAQNVAQVERATQQRTNDIERAANQSVEQAKRAAAKNTAAVKEQAAAQEAAAEKAIQANLQATTDAANRQAEKVATDAARNTARVRADAARSVKNAEQDTAQKVKQIARDVAREQKDALRERDRAVQASKDKEIAAEKAIQAESHRTRDAIILDKANADPAIAALLQAQGVIDRGASGKWEVILDDPTKQAIAKLDQYFGPNAVSLDASGHIAIAGDFNPLNQQINSINGKIIGSAKIAINPVGLGPHRDGGIVGYANGGVTPANPRFAIVGEAGPEIAQFPAGTYIRPHPASAASGMGGVVVNVHFHEPVYSMDDFEAKVQRAAMAGLSRGLPGAITSRRRALGAA